MAEFKTAEQYVVEKVESLEQEIDNTKIAHAIEVGKLTHRAETAEAKLVEMCSLLNMLRDFIDVRHDSYFGNCIYFETIYGKEHPDIVAGISEYFDIHPEEDEEDE